MSAAPGGGARRLSRLSRSVAGRVAIVTGAGSGMGRATAYLLADEGASVAICDRNQESIDDTAAAMRAAHGDAAVVAIACDVSDAAQLASLVDATVERFGGIDIVVNNAGVAGPSPLDAQLLADDQFDRTWHTTFDVNVGAYAVLVRLALPHLRESDAARIVNIASTEAIVATPGLAAYSASKAAVAGLTRSMAVELGREGITANCICPGPIETGMTADIPADAKATYARRRVPLRRYGEPEEVAQIIVSLCLPAASYLNGATIPVDGGMTIRHT